MSLVARTRRNPILFATFLLILVAISLLLASLLIHGNSGHLIGLGYTHGPLAWQYNHAVAWSYGQ